MDALRKQATKFREQVAKQQQAVLKQFSNHGPTGDVIITDEAELQRHQQLEKLFTSTRAGKHYQRDIVKGVEGLISTGVKQLEIATRLAEDCRKYAAESPNIEGALAKASVHYSEARFHMEKERDALHRALSTQVVEPLRAMVMGAPLEDARHLVQRYDRLRQEAEQQCQEVEKRQSRSREGGADNAVKLQLAESRMGELTSAMAVLGKEAAAAMSAVEAQQQRLTLQRLISMVEAERNYHIRLAEVLDQLYAQMIVERQRNEALPLSQGVSNPAISHDDTKSNGSLSSGMGNALEKSMYFLAEVMHPFDAESENELTLAVGDYVVVRQVSTTGWSEGECKGTAGWFPSTYVERRQRVPAHKVADTPGL